MTPTEDPPPALPPACEPTVASVSSAGGVIVFDGCQDDGISLTLDVPPGAVDGVVSLTYVPIPDMSQPPAPDDQFVGPHFELNAAPEGTPVSLFWFNKPVTFVLTYPGQTELDEESLTLFYFDEAGQIWESAACGDTCRDQVDNEISVEVCHLSEFAFFSHPERAQVFLPVVTR